MLEWIESRTSHLIPKQNGTLLCSGIDPLAEAKKWVARQEGDIRSYDVFFVLGLAGGFHISQLAQSFPNSEIIVIEPLKDLERELLSRRGPIAENVTIISGLSPEEVKNNVFVRSGLKSLYRVLAYPTSCRLNKTYFEEIESLLIGRDKNSFMYHLEGRTHLRRFFDTLDVFQDKNQSAITILDIERALRKRSAPLEREGMIFMALRELIK